MRATISFDIDLGKVEETMAALVSQEAANLLATANILDNVSNGSLLHEVTEAVDLLQETASQLQQYKSMIVNFEKARLEHSNPIVSTQGDPQDTDLEPTTVNSFTDVRKVIQDMEGFDSFLSQLPTEDSVDLEVEEDEES